jgi:DNA polymerase-3 subunit epsilon
MQPIEAFINVVKHNNFVILDTETTGLRSPAEICQIALLDNAGNELLYSYVKTANPIPRDATNIHGITTDMVKDALTWPEIKPMLTKLLQGKDIIVYNATYDRQMMHCSDEAWNLPKTNYHNVGAWHCAMLWYADFWGEWDDYHGNNRWQRLSVACAQQGIVVADAHDALGDCKMTYALINAVCAKHSL